MRQIGTLPNVEHAQRFAAYLLTQKIPAHAEQSSDAWAIWVKNEDQVAVARQSLADFQAAPDDPRYNGVQARAAEIERQEQARRHSAKKNVVEMRGRWQRGGGGIGFRQAPLTYVLIGLSLFVAMLTRLGSPDSPASMAALGALSFYEVSPRELLESGLLSGELREPIDGMAQIRRGQVWRLVTPIFIHFGWLHLIFNMMMLHQFATVVEKRYGTWRLGAAVLIIAIASNTLQYLWELNFRFGGMSGVVYGVFGLIWMKSLFDARSGLQISNQTVVFMLVWMFLCMAASLPQAPGFLSSIGNVANTAHFVGLAAGMAIAFTPRLFD